MRSTARSLPLGGAFDGCCVIIMCAGSLLVFQKHLSALCASTGFVALHTTLYHSNVTCILTCTTANCMCMAC